MEGSILDALSTDKVSHVNKLLPHKFADGREKK